MTPQELLAAAEAGTLNMDSDEDTLKEPPQAEQPSEQTQATTDAAPDDAEAAAPISSKSGAYTIPYEKLAQAREQAKVFASENELLKQQLAQLSSAQAANLAQSQSQAQDRADAGLAATSSDANLEAAQQAVADGIDPALFGDFSEEGIAKGVKALVAQGVQQAIAPLMQERQAAAQHTAAASHYEAIYAAHPDADELAQSAEFASWRNNLPNFARAAVDQTLTHGDASGVVDIFNTFKASAKPAPAGSKVQQAIAAAQGQASVPTSLSELTGQASSGSPAEQIAAMAGDPASLMSRMSEMTPAQLEKLMNSV
ncbi:MAG: hypothetical protein PHU77_00190 [Simplicispira sp.]|nr:hypothetical protein [Simplicispira sp.]